MEINFPVEFNLPEVDEFTRSDLSRNFIWSGTIKVESPNLPFRIKCASIYRNARPAHLTYYLEFMPVRNVQNYWKDKYLNDFEVLKETILEMCIIIWPNGTWWLLGIFPPMVSHMSIGLNVPLKRQSIH